MDRAPADARAPARPGAAAPVSALGSLAAAGAEIRILLAEDDPVSQEVALALLAGSGIQVDVASNGAEAVLLMAETPYDLVLMDMQMPVMDGLAATRTIRAMANRGGVPILAMTANACGEDRHKCLAAGMDDFMTKPVTPERLYAALSKWLPCQLTEAPRAAAATAADTADAALFSVDGLDARAGLQHMAGNLASYRSLLRLYLGTHRDDMDRLGRHLDAGERDAARRIAHSLKGASGSVGALTLQSLAADTERALRDGAPETTLRDSVERLDTALAGLLGALATALGEPDLPAGSAPGNQPKADLGRLKQLLRADDIRAGDALRALLPTLGRVLSREALARLMGQVQALDYPSALETLDRLERESP